MTAITPSLMTTTKLDVPGYEQVVLAEDDATGLRAIVAIHDTRLGPALGGTRFRSYATEDDALRDVLRLSAGMTYKAAAADLALGGGKAVIIGDPDTSKSPALLRAYGRFVQSFDGMYITAADVGTNANDLNIVGETTAHVVGRTPEAGGLGDSGYSTALGVLCSMRAAVRFAHGRALKGVKVGVEGAGKVGFQLVSLLVEDGAEVWVCEPHAPASEMLRQTFPGVVVVEDVFDAPVDVYSPCALGATVTVDSIPRLSATVVCGAANNQLESEELEDELAARNILWVPDYVANAGGLIQVAAEREGGTLAEARVRVRELEASVMRILDRGAADGLTPAAAARVIVEDRLARPRVTDG